MKEDDAKTKWCPNINFIQYDGFPFTNRGEPMTTKGSINCIGSRCMMWRWSNYGEIINGVCIEGFVD